MAICPAGHPSTSADYCDTCGLPIGSEQPVAQAPVAAEASDANHCPHCNAPNAPDALFCEACGYDFTTGTPPRSASTVPSQDLPASGSTEDGAGASAEPFDRSGDAHAEGADEATGSAADAGHLPPPALVVPADPAAAADAPPSGLSAVLFPSPEPQAPPVPPGGSGSEHGSSDAPAAGAGSDEPPSDAPDAAGPSSEVPQPPDGDPPAPGGSPARQGRLLQPRPTSVEWVAEVWIDPDWYVTQGSTDALPSPGLPDVVPLRAASALIGRVSASRNIHPDVDCDPDTGVSRRHAQVSTDGTRWWIEDLESANGTFVGPSAGPLPTEPIGRGRVEFTPEQRIYLGGWTRIVIRKATDDERQAFAG